MTLTITFTVEEEARLRIAAQREGIDPAELVHQLVRAHLPPTSDENAASIALLQSWLEEDAKDNSDDIQQAEAALEALNRPSTLNANALAHGASIHESRHRTRHRAIGIAYQSQEDT
jgi:hypothetical protein